jgi:hypothetical protein
MKRRLFSNVLPFGIAIGTLALASATWVLPALHYVL